MLVSIAAAARRFGVEPTEQAVTAALGEPAGIEDHAAFMARQFPSIAASGPVRIHDRIATALPGGPNEKTARDRAFGKRRAADSGPAVAVPSTPATMVVHDLPGFLVGPEAAKAKPFDLAEARRVQRTAPGHF
jgi:hypothetical protein